MKETFLNCTNCNLNFNWEEEYKNHFKSDFHRYNIKRRLINLPPASLCEFEMEFLPSLRAESTSTVVQHCAPCSKKFLSQGTFKQHLNSKKHKESVKECQNIKVDDSSSFASFELIESKCLFCPATISERHLKEIHGFPPYFDECLDKHGLIECVREKLRSKSCLYCEQQFETERAAQQHMTDLNHCSFSDMDLYEEYYCWKNIECDTEEENSATATFEEIEIKRLNRIIPISIGAIINGKEVGCRKFKQYYKQYLVRNVETFYKIKSIQSEESYKNEKENRLEKACKIIKNRNFR